MADITSRGITHAFTVTTRDEGGQWSFLPLNINFDKVYETQYKTAEMFVRFGRRANLDRMDDQGKIYYGITPKAKWVREFKTVIDSDSGLHTIQSMLGVQTDNADPKGGTFGYIEPTTTSAFLTFVQPQPLKYLKEIFAKKELVRLGFDMVANRVYNYSMANVIDMQKSLKFSLVDSIGRIGAFAQKFGWKPPTTAPRLKIDTFTLDETGGFKLYDEIDKMIQYSTKIGLDDGTGVEIDYAFQGGRDISDYELIISRTGNRILARAFQNSYAFKFVGMEFDETSGLVKNMFGVNTTIMDLPIKVTDDNKNVEILAELVVKGDNGAIIIPVYWDTKFSLWDSTPAMASEFVQLEGTGGQVALQYLQPELNFAIGQEITVPPNPQNDVDTYNTNISNASPYTSTKNYETISELTDTQTPTALGITLPTPNLGTTTVLTFVSKNDIAKTVTYLATISKSEATDKKSTITIKASDAVLLSKNKQK